MKASTILNKLAKFLLVAAFWLAVWEAIALAVDTEILVPTPLKVASVWASLIKTDTFFISCLYSILRISGGFLAAVVSGTLLGVVCHRFGVARALVSPILKVIRSTPVISFIILALVWIKTDFLPVFIAFLMVLPIIYTAVETGLDSVDIRLLEMAKVFKMSRRAVIRTIYLPSVLPSFVAQSTVGLGFAWKSGIAAEVICLPLISIGRELKNAKANIDTLAVFAWTATVIILSLIIEWALRRVAKRFEGRWSK